MYTHQIKKQHQRQIHQLVIRLIYNDFRLLPIANGGGGKRDAAKRVASAPSPTERARNKPPMQCTVIALPAPHRIATRCRALSVVSPHRDNARTHARVQMDVYVPWQPASPTGVGECAGGVRSGAVGSCSDVGFGARVLRLHAGKIQQYWHVCHVDNICGDRWQPCEQHKWCTAALLRHAARTYVEKRMENICRSIMWS